MAEKVKRRVFISYAHASEEHQVWVKKLADSLRTQSILVTLDQDDLRLGQLIRKFQSEGISLADRVLVICSESYVEKCDTDKASGAGQEKELIGVEVKGDQGTVKFIPILRNNQTANMPLCLRGRLWLDGNRDQDFDDMVKRLSAEIKRP